MLTTKFNNMLMTGGALTIAEGDINFHGSGESTVNSGIKDLYLNIAAGAFHDSEERFNPPQCHPNTRVTIIQEILDWLDDMESPKLVMWLHGAAGAGKTAIAQTIAQMLCEQGRLSGSFFFARGSTTGRGDQRRLVPTLAYQLSQYSPETRVHIATAVNDESTTGRGDQRRLVPTLAYQLSQYLPETRVHIATAVNDDPAIFDLTLLSQVQKLLINPLCLASVTLSSTSNAPPRLFIIDGLDECRDADAQCRILQVFSATVKDMQHLLPHKILIASRSEIQILAGFNEHDTSSLCCRLPLDNNYFPDNDIRRFLQDSFSKIRDEHRMRAYLQNSWPSEEIIVSLIRKSSGQFIYASTVVKYVASVRHHPAERLKIILGLKTAGRNDRPFAALDSLYAHIFQSVEDIDLVLCILRLELAGSFGPILREEHTVEGYRTLLDITAEELELALGDLVSVISFERATGWFRFLHASISDFLVDPHRSTTFYVDQRKVNVYRAECCIKVLRNIYDGNIGPCYTPYAAAWFHLSDCIGRLADPEDKNLLYQLLSSLDINRALDHHPLPHVQGSLVNPFRHIARVLLWSLQERQTHPERAASLLKLTRQFDSWLLSRLQSVLTNGFDNELGIDLMVFAMMQIDGDETLLEHRLNIIGILQDDSRIPPAVVTALRLSRVPSREGLLLYPWHSWVHRNENAEYFPLFHCFFHDIKRSGKYYMSGVRYANAALHCVNFLFDPRPTDTSNWDEYRCILERATLYLTMEYVTFFLGKATAAQNLFKLLLDTITIPNSTSEISTSIKINARCRLISRIDAIFSIGPKKISSEDSLACALYPSRIFNIAGDKNFSQWREESVQMVTAAMSEYVSTRCQSFFKFQNSTIQPRH